MVFSREFPNLKLDHLKALESHGIIAAFGFRTCIILNNELDIIQRYLDSNKTENFYCCEFFENGKENQVFICLGGECGVIKIIDVRSGLLFGFMKGHMGAICSIKAFDRFLISCSEDSTIRIWDITMMKCIGVCGGLSGHKDHVLSLDIMYDKTMLVSTGTDCVIKQWLLKPEIDKYIQDQSYIFNYSPYTSFSGIHKCPISKVKYYGNMIVSLSNNVISMIFNNTKNEIIQEKFQFNRAQPFFIGSIDMYGNCKTFDIVGHVLLGLSSTGDIYIFDLRNIAKEKTPFIVESHLGAGEDLACLGDLLYISTGGSISKIKIDLSRFI